MIASNPSWNLMLVLPLAVRTVMLIVRSFRENREVLTWEPARYASKTWRVGPG